MPKAATPTKQTTLRKEHVSCTVICDDSRRALSRFKGQVDLIITSPPYADARKQHYDSVSPNDYATWFQQFHQPFWDALKPTGSLVINIKDKVVDGVRSRYVWQTMDALCNRGWQAIDDYVWNKPNAMPGRWPTRLSDGWEYCFHLGKTKQPFFDREAVRKPISPVTLKRVANIGKNDLGRRYSASGSGFNRDLTKWIGKTHVLPSNVLTLAHVSKNVGHPAAYPTKLPDFFIRLLCPPNGLVIDPFAGSGSTGIAALELDRNCILIDNQPQYFDVALSRLRNTVELTAEDAKPCQF